jgi:hypothetical protein
MWAATTVPSMPVQRVRKQTLSFVRVDDEDHLGKSVGIAANRGRRAGWRGFLTSGQGQAEHAGS